jgi:hypothetical protein
VLADVYSSPSRISLEHLTSKPQRLSGYLQKVCKVIYSREPHSPDDFAIFLWLPPFRKAVNMVADRPKKLSWGIAPRFIFDCNYILGLVIRK